MKKAALYWRVDAGGSPESLALAAMGQRQVLEQAARDLGLCVTGVYGDLACSGLEGGREGLGLLLADARAGCFEQILVMDRSRLWRGGGPCPLDHAPAVTVYAVKEDRAYPLASLKNCLDFSLAANKKRL